MTDQTPAIGPGFTPELPGFELPQHRAGQIGPNTAAISRTVARLNEAGVLTVEHDDYVQAALTLAGHVDRLPVTAKAYAVSNLLGQYLEALKALHPAPGERETSEVEAGALLDTALERILEDDGQ